VCIARSTGGGSPEVAARSYPLVEQEQMEKLCSPTKHNFKVYDIVIVKHKAPWYVPRGSYAIVRQLWSEAEGAHYRVKSLWGGHQRTLREAHG
jgi:hypothetical protein